MDLYKDGFWVRVVRNRTIGGLLEKQHLNQCHLFLIKLTDQKDTLQEDGSG